MDGKLVFRNRSEEELVAGIFKDFPNPAALATLVLQIEGIVFFLSMLIFALILFRKKQLSGIVGLCTYFQ